MKSFRETEDMKPADSSAYRLPEKRKNAVAKEDYDTLTTLAKEGIASCGEIGRLWDKLSDFSRRLSNERSANARLQAKYEELKEICKQNYFRQF